jgi:hypothetical protein
VDDLCKSTFYDRPPTRVGMCCFCIPCTCCGPPVIFSYSPKCCTIDCSDNCGQQIKAAPCNCFGLKTFLCCGNPCYVNCSYPLLVGVKNADVFLSKWQAAVSAYQTKTGISKGEFVVFESVEDNLYAFGGSNKVPEAQMMAK